MTGEDGNLAVELTTVDVLPQEFVDVLASNEAYQKSGVTNEDVKCMNYTYTSRKLGKKQN